MIAGLGIAAEHGAGLGPVPAALIALAVVAITSALAWWWGGRR